MNQLTFNEDEIKTIKQLIEDWGFEYGLKADRDKVRELANKVRMPYSFIKNNFDDA